MPDVYHAAVAPTYQCSSSLSSLSSLPTNAAVSGKRITPSS